MSEKFDRAAFQRVIENDNYESREKYRELGRDPIMTPVYNISLSYSRELALERLQKVTSLRATSVRDFGDNPRNIFSTHEMLGYIDASLATKYTLQFNLYGGSIFHLGTERHAEWIPKVDDLTGIGCFCLTELGYGNNAVEMKTTAHYEHDTQEFVINSPTTLS